MPPLAHHPLQPQPTLPPPPQKNLPVCCVCHCALCKVYKDKGSFQGKTLRLRQRRRFVKHFNFVSTVMQMDGLRPGHSLRLLQRHH